MLTSNFQVNRHVRFVGVPRLSSLDGYSKTETLPGFGHERGAPKSAKLTEGKPRLAPSAIVVLPRIPRLSRWVKCGAKFELRPTRLERPPRCYITSPLLANNHTKHPPIMSAHLDWDWELEIQYNPRELGEDLYEIYFFIKPVPPSPSEWRYSHSLLFEPVASNAPHTVTEFRSLNGYLEPRCDGHLRDDDVIPYLKEQLTWRVKKVRGDEDRRSVTSRISSQRSVISMRRLTTRNSNY